MAPLDKVYSILSEMREMSAEIMLSFPLNLTIYEVYPLKTELNVLADA